MHGGLNMIFGWLAILFIVVLGARYLLGDPWTLSSRNKPDKRGVALNILQERYALGELSEADYQRMKANLQL